MDHGYGGRRDPFVIYHERVADSRDTLRATPRLAERTMEIAMDRGKQLCQAVRARAARNRDRVLGPAALSVKTDKSFLHRRSIRACRPCVARCNYFTTGWPPLFRSFIHLRFLSLPPPCHFSFPFGPTIEPRISVQFHTPVKIIESAVHVVFAVVCDTVNSQI